MNSKINRKQKIVVLIMVVMGLLYPVAYFALLWFSARAFESYANSKLEEALKHAQVALWLAQKILPENSETTYRLTVFSTKISTESAPYFLDNGRTVSRYLFKLATNNLNPATSGPLFLLSSEIANNSFNPDISSAAAHRGLKILRDTASFKDQGLSDKLYQERALGNLLSFKGVEGEDEWEFAAEREFKSSINRLCEASSADCKYYSIRWELAKCIRSKLLKGDDLCVNDVLLEAVDGKRLCQNLTTRECMDVYQRLRPFEFQLLSLTMTRGEK